jgi:peptidoglycan/LPS O-acetylase OafA/YrhL
MRRAPAHRIPRISLYDGKRLAPNFDRLRRRMTGGDGEDIMKASSLSFQAAVLFVLAGMIWGIVMAASGDHSTMPAHAHLNLLGWVSLFLFGVYYRLHPSLEHSRVAFVQIAVWCVGTIVLAVAVGMIHTGTPAAEPAAALSSILLVADMLLFGWLVYRGDRARIGTASPAPAE